jgi:hypothetical protein
MKCDGCKQTENIKQYYIVNWGYFNYCKECFKKDKDNGLVIEESEK